MSMDFSAPVIPEAPAAEVTQTEPSQDESNVEDYPEPDISEDFADQLEKDGQEDLIPKQQRDRRKAEKNGPATVDAEQKQESKPTVQEIELSVNGEKIKYDLGNSDKVKADIQKGLAADAKFQEASKIRKQATDFISELRRNPLKVLQHPDIGINFKELAEQVVYEDYLLSKMSPEEAKRYQQNKDRDEELETLRRDREERERLDKDSMTSHFKDHFSKAIPEAIVKSGLPDSQFVRARVAQYMLHLLNNGHSSVSPDDVMPQVVKDYQHEQRHLFSQTSDEKLLEVLGPDAAKKLKSPNPPSAPVKQAPPPSATRNAAPPPPQPKKEEKRVYRNVHQMLKSL